MSKEISKERYEHHKKLICDKNDTYMPKHTHAVIITMLEQVLMNQEIILSHINQSPSTDSSVLRKKKAKE